MVLGRIRFSFSFIRSNVIFNLKSFKLNKFLLNLFELSIKISILDQRVALKLENKKDKKIDTVKLSFLARDRDLSYRTLIVVVIDEII